MPSQIFKIPIPKEVFNSFLEENAIIKTNYYFLQRLYLSPHNIMKRFNHFWIK